LALSAQTSAKVSYQELELMELMEQAPLKERGLKEEQASVVVK
jgi:hypothetical protein